MSAFAPRLLALAVAVAGLLAAAAPAPAAPSVFERPALDTALKAAAAELAQGRAADALVRLEGLRARVPDDPALEALRAAALVALDRAGEGAQVLRGAAELGLPELPELLRLPAFAALRDDPALAGLPPAPARAEPPLRPARVVGNGAHVGPANTRWLPGPGLLEALLAFPPSPSRDRGPAIRRGETAPELALIAAWRRRGAAAGHGGDVYDNRDRGHSSFDTGPFLQLATTNYAPEAKAAGLDYGLNDRLRMTATVFGNSSTALVDPARERSLARLAMTTPGAPARLWELYAANHLYVYPEHRDHDPETGDLFPAAMPYVLVSQGSSGSDQPLLRALAVALAALRPDTKARLRALGLVAPTLQMLLRRTRMGGDATAYLTGLAHPSAFDGASIDLVALAKAANALAPDAIPPMARLRVAAESDPGPLFADGLDERLFDTPAAVARVAHGLAFERRYVLEAEAADAPSGRAAKPVWRVLRGDPAQVTLTPLDAEGRRVEVAVRWSTRAQAPGRRDLTTDRVEIALFLDAGATLSAPAFFTVHFPPRQARVYAEDGRILSVDWAAADRAGRYEDPLIVPRRGWRDDFAYDAAGALVGWTRTGGGRTERFTRHGARVLSTDAEGRPLDAEPVRHRVDVDAAGRRAVAVVAADQTPLRYAYDGPEDRAGWLDVPPAAVPAAPRPGADRDP